MKSRIVLWGETEKEKKILVALELIADQNEVVITSFSEDLATELFYNEMMEKWRNGSEVPFPEGHQTLSRPLSITEDILPENIKVERTDLIARAKTEWHFAVLSSKLYQMYKSELEEYKERLSKLVNYDQNLWDDLKGFWTKVQNQATDRNLFRDHIKELKEQTNSIFNDLKEKKSILNEEFKKSSQTVASKFNEQLEVLETKIEKGLGLKPIFNELKDLQSEFKSEKMTHGDKRRIWDRIDKAFKAVKEKRFGPESSNQSNVTNRLQSRYNGLLNAIGKMESSLKRDKNDIAFQQKRIRDTDGQLELQIRQAKTKMIEERISSKEIKYQDMLNTRKQLEEKMDLENKKEEARKKKAEQKKKIELAKKEVKVKIADQIEQDKTERKPQEEHLKSAAEAIKEAKPKRGPKKQKKESKEPKIEEDSLVSAIGLTMGEALEDVIDTVKAVAEVVGDKVGDKIDEIKEDLKEKLEENEIIEEKKEENAEESIDQTIAEAKALNETIEAKLEKKENVDEKKEENVEESIDQTIAEAKALNETIEAKLEKASKEEE